MSGAIAPSVRTPRNATAAAFHGRFTLCRGHQLGAPEIDVSGTGAMVIVNGFGGSRHYGDAENRHRLAGYDRPCVLLSRIGNLRYQRRERKK